MQSSDVKTKLFWRAKKKDQQLKPPTPTMKGTCHTGYYWKWTKENAQKLVKKHQDSKDIQKSAWNHGTMKINEAGKVQLPKYNDFLSDTRSLIQ